MFRVTVRLDRCAPGKSVERSLSCAAVNAAQAQTQQGSECYPPINSCPYLGPNINELVFRNNQLIPPRLVQNWRAEVRVGLQWLPAVPQRNPPCAPSWS